MPRPKQRTPELRETILAAALELLASNGVPAITTREVARQAGTSLPAVYELFGDKAGLIRAMFFTGFERLSDHLHEIKETDQPLQDLRAGALAYRSFVAQNPTLFDVMYSRPFVSFDPGPDEQTAGTTVREFMTRRIDRCASDGLIEGDSTDIAHALLGLILGLARQESSGWLGSTNESRDRRWELGVDVFLSGLASPKQ